MKTRQLLVLSLYGGTVGTNRKEVLDGAALIYKKYSSRDECCFHAALHLDLNDWFNRSSKWTGPDSNTEEGQKIMLQRMEVMASNLGNTLETILGFFKTGSDIGVYILGHCGTGIHDRGIARMPNEILANLLTKGLGLTEIRKMCLVACNTASASQCKDVDVTVAKDLHGKLKASGIQTMLAGYSVAVFTRDGDEGSKTYAPPGNRNAREPFNKESRALYKKVFGWGPDGSQIELTVGDFHDNDWR